MPQEYQNDSKEKSGDEKPIEASKAPRDKGAIHQNKSEHINPKQSEKSDEVSNSQSKVNSQIEAEKSNFDYKNNSITGQLAEECIAGNQPANTESDETQVGESPASQSQGKEAQFSATQPNSSGFGNSLFDETKMKQNQVDAGYSGQAQNASAGQDNKMSQPEDISSQDRKAVPVVPQFHAQVQYAYPPNPMGGYPYPPRVQRKKMSLALKVFIGIVTALFVGTVVGFVSFLVYSGSTQESNSFFDSLPNLPNDKGEETLPIPNYDDLLSRMEEEIEQPDIEVQENPKGISIAKKPVSPELEAKEVYEKVVKSTVTVQATQDGNFDEDAATGTGIIATSDGYIITNSHVVLNTKNISVRAVTHDGQEYDAVVVGVDRTTDLAVIKTNNHNFIPAEFGDADELSIGEWVIAIGNPGGARFSSSLTRGVVSGLDRIVGQYSENGMTYIQTDAAINPGNSGGPLVNMFGQVIGINSSKIITTGFEGMGFAIPVSKAELIINELFTGGYVKGRTRLGIKGIDVSEYESSAQKIPLGFRILEIDSDSGFYQDEIQAGDVIVEIDDEEVAGITGISNLLLKYEPGDEIKVKLYRPDANRTSFKDEYYTASVKLLEDKGETQR